MTDSVVERLEVSAKASFLMGLNHTGRNLKDGIAHIRALEKERDFGIKEIVRLNGKLEERRMAHGVTILTLERVVAERDTLRSQLATAREALAEIVRHCNPRHQAVRHIRSIATAALNKLESEA